jgi:hypothetical protein
MPTFDYNLFPDTRTDFNREISIDDIPPKRLLEIAAWLDGQTFNSLAEYHAAILRRYSVPGPAPMPERSPMNKRPKNRKRRYHTTANHVIRREDLAETGKGRAILADAEVYPPHQPDASANVHRPIPPSDPIPPSGYSEDDLRQWCGLDTAQETILDALDRKWTAEHTAAQAPPPPPPRHPARFSAEHQRERDLLAKFKWRQRAELRKLEQRAAGMPPRSAKRQKRAKLTAAASIRYTDKPPRPAAPRQRVKVSTGKKGKRK